MKRTWQVRGAVTLLSLIVVISLPAALGAIPAGADTPQVEASLGTWSFRHGNPLPESDGSFVVNVDYAKGSAAEVRAAAAAMNVYAEQLALGGTPFRATLVFTMPLTVDEFTQFAAKTGIAPLGSIVRLVQPDGIRVTMSVPPVWSKDEQGRPRLGQAVPGQVPFDGAALANMRSRHPDDRLLGVISVDIVLDTPTFQRVRGTPEVFAVDILQEVVTKQVQQRHRNTATQEIHVRQSQLYWAMEDTGLAVSR